MPTPAIEIRNPSGNPTLLLETGGSGNYFLPIASGVAKNGGCLYEVKALVFSNPSDKTATPPTIDPPGIPIAALASEITPPMPYCQYMDNSWLVRAVPKAVVGQNYLRVWGRFSATGTWYFGDADFVGTLNTPPPPRPTLTSAGSGPPYPPLPAAWLVEVASALDLSLFPDQLRLQSGLLQLAQKEVLLQLDSPPENPAWSAGDPVAGTTYWRLSLLSSNIAELVLRIRV